jgi:diaminopimelate epimerase
MDGCLAEFCGNGARACAAHLYKRFPEVEKVYLCSSTRTHEAFRYQDDIYSISLPPVSFKPNPKFVTDIKLLPEGFYYAEILEPHLILNRKLCDEELLLIGQKLNRNKELFPYGVNVNSWHVLEDNVLHVKTYERGVQRLTRSCGTGSTSCAAFYKKHGMVSVQTSGGILEIHLTNDHVKLKGPARCWELGEGEKYNE